MVSLNGPVTIGSLLNYHDTPFIKLNDQARVSFVEALMLTDQLRHIPIADVADWRFIFGLSADLEWELPIIAPDAVLIGEAIGRRWYGVP